MSSQKMHVLVIEDSSFDIKWITKELRSSRIDLEVFHAKTMAEAKQFLADTMNIVDVVLLDLNLPDSHGLESLRSGLEISGDTPIVVLTGEDRDDVAYDAASIGAQDFLVKSNKVGPSLRKAIHFVVSRQRVTDELRKNIDVLSIAAKLDPLTGLYNRRHFEEELSRLWDDFKESGKQFSCILVDLDFFSEINNTHGHAVGDEVLRRASVSLRSRVRECDTVARFGGEEFCVLLPEANERAAYRLAERMRVFIEQDHCIIDGTRIQITASFGVAASESSMESQNDLVVAADDALYSAKNKSRNTVATASYQKPLESLI